MTISHRQMSQNELQVRWKLSSIKEATRSINKLLVYGVVLVILELSLGSQQLLETNNKTTEGFSPDNKINSTLDLKEPNSTQTNPISTNTTSGEVILSGDEFVDFTEAPTLLFDGTLNDNNATQTNTTTLTSNIETTTKPETTTNSEPEETNTSKEVPLDNSDDLNDEGNDENEDENEASRGKEFKPPQNVSQYMDYIERLFHDLRHQITDLFEPHIPQLIRTSQMVKLSSSCSYDMLKLALALRQFEPWALRMIDSSGKMPEGIFEGSFTALGSYDECLNTNFAIASSSLNSNGDNSNTNNNNEQDAITQGKYCLVNLSPFLPPKPPADRVELMFQDEANRRNYTKENQFSRLSPMFYYMKFRIGVCVPSTCANSDLESISEALSSSLRLNITIPHCKVKEQLPLTEHQLVGGFIFGLVLALVIGSTMMDYSSKKMNKTATRNRRPASIASDRKEAPNKFGIPIPIKGTHESKFLNHHHQQQQQEELTNEWTWMSFSAITNYKLYFQNKTMNLLNGTTGARGNHKGCNYIGLVDGCEKAPSIMIINCLNGIRVLSLCWVIIANSYITLDPRATKRLSKTREAPKDFLFQLIVQASLAIETFFFLSGLLMSLSFFRRFWRGDAEGSPKLNDSTKDKKMTSFTGKMNTNKYPASTEDRKDKREKQESVMPVQQTNERKQETQTTSNVTLKWIHFYVHRYVRMTPATMLVIAFTMFAFRYGDGPLWLETTQKAHLSCNQNWWRHLLHVANFIDTRQMCFIHYWYIAADMQLFLFAPILLFILFKYRRLGYAMMAVIGSLSVANVFYITYTRNLPPTLLFYNSDPESRREFGNTIMTKPLTHVLPYMVGMLVGKWLAHSNANHQLPSANIVNSVQPIDGSLRTLLSLIALLVALGEVFLPYKWNNSHLPTRLLASIYAALFRLAWSLALAYLVVSCRHRKTKHCKNGRLNLSSSSSSHVNCCCHTNIYSRPIKCLRSGYLTNMGMLPGNSGQDGNIEWCFCGNGGNIVNRFLSLNIFASLSKLSFVAYLIHLPLMSVFVAQTRGLFAFSHILVVHLALSYLLMTFILSFILVHIIEFPFITLEKYLFGRLYMSSSLLVGWSSSSSSSSSLPTSEPSVNKEIHRELSEYQPVVLSLPENSSYPDHNNLTRFIERL